MAKRAASAGEPRKEVKIDLALQGGGSHGAFTWGVLDRLLEEPWLKIEAISGTSAGAMNAAVLVDGWTQGGAEGARAALDAYWARVAERRRLQPAAALAARPAAGPLDARHPRRPISSMDLMSRVFSPYDLNPLGVNPLRDILAEEHRFRAARRGRRSSCSSPRPMCTPAAAACSATPRSRRTSCSPRPACRPCSRRSRSTASPIGTAATPAIRPSRRWCAKATRTTRSWCRSIRANGAETPRTAAEILNRLNEISFNSPLMKELRMIALLRQVADPGHRRGRALGADAHAPDHHRQAGRFRRLLEAQRRMGLPHDAAGRGPPDAPTNSWTSMATISASARPPISDVLLAGGAERMGTDDRASRHPGRRSALLIWLAFRGWSVLLLAPLAAR